MGVPSDYLVSTQLQLWLFCCWGCGCCWAVTTCILHSFHLFEINPEYTLPVLQVLAWLSLFVPVESVPGRVGMGMTTLLTLTAMFSSVRRTQEISFLDLFLLGQTKCSSRLLHFFPRHLDALLHDVRLCVHPRVHHCDNLHQSRYERQGRPGVYVKRFLLSCNERFI